MKNRSALLIAALLAAPALWAQNAPSGAPGTQSQPQVSQSKKDVEANLKAEKKELKALRAKERAELKGIDKSSMTAQAKADAKKALRERYAKEETAIRERYGDIKGTHKWRMKGHRGERTQPEMKPEAQPGSQGGK